MEICDAGETKTKLEQQESSSNTGDCIWRRIQNQRKCRLKASCSSLEMFAPLLSRKERYLDLYLKGYRYRRMSTVCANIGCNQWQELGEIRIVFVNSVLCERLSAEHKRSIEFLN
jgi:hypothetical protein